MATQSRRAQNSSTDDAARVARGALTSGAAAAADMARQQLALAADLWATLLRAGESVQQAQLHMTQRASLLHRQAAENLRKAETPLELMSVQANLLAYDFQESMRYLQELLQAGTRAGSDGLSRAEPREQDAATQAASAAAQAVGAAMNAAAPMAQAWQQMFTAPMAAQKPH
ncbi:hypothetical protein PE066_12730 [Ramlibacter tataouinensis]|uniref:hypothetical protein n=1 Tax=Ramlibacter tataouinensis TaxID=94132 RepID=UPI0022F382CE|nr:hypothetical protein [Ramlibacter tataouinensis]WBY00338.1 hypothetical protein PE066_12730 [Ramlibacter tataouinensis]